MSARTEAALAAAIERRAGALVGYLPIGYPDLQTSIDAAVALIENGFDILELGPPYSDPVMDGEIIQQATQAALAAGFKLCDLFTAVREISARVDAPILVMSYWNPIVQYGVDRFADDLKAAGGAGLITPDITPETAGEWIAASKRTGLDRVFLAAPTSSDERLAMITEASTGFIYTVSTMGITGERQTLDANARTLVGRLREHGAARACVGIGISTAEHVAGVLEYADGAIIGTALVRALRDGGVEGIARTARELAQGAARTH